MNVLRLYIAGKNVRLKGDVENLRTFLKKSKNTDYELQVIDVLKDPLSASTDNIFATPTIIWTASKESKRIVGNISDPGKIATLLGLS